MAIKYLRGIYGLDQVKTTRPVGFKFPLGLTATNDLSQANSSTTPTGGTFDVLLVAGGGSGGYAATSTARGGGGGAGGVRLLTANSITEITESKNPSFITGTTNFIPVVVGGANANTCFGNNFTACRGGGGGVAFNGAPPAAASGGSGGGGGKSYFNTGTGGSGIVGQGCNGGNAGPAGPGAAGGAATSSATPTPTTTNANGLTTSFTGTPIRFGDGGAGATTSSCVGTPGTVNRGNGGAGAGGHSAGPYGRAGGGGGSGIVAIRYCNPAAPTTPLATGGDCICCTGGCIIHIFNSSGFLNVNTSFSIN